MGWGILGTIGSAISSGISSLTGMIGSGLSKLESLAKTAITSISGVIGSGIKSLGKLVPTAIKAINTICPKGGGLLGELSSVLTKVLTPVFGPLAPILSSIGVDLLSNMLVNTLIPGNKMTIEDTEEYGALIEESRNHPDWNSSSAFSNAQEYYEYLKNKAKEESVQILPVSKLSAESMKRRSVAIVDFWERLEEADSIKIGSDFLVFAALKLFTEDQLKAVIQVSKELGFDSVKFLDLKNGKLTPEITTKFNEGIIKALQNFNREKNIYISEDEAYQTLVNMKKSVPESKEFVDSMAKELKHYSQLSNKELFNEESLVKEISKYNDL
ncbi:hypothetical protein [Veillonella atypica]|uniref:hypothetical protein n=2 Tax=Bacillota TaxID=1239 RepID=UPI00352C05E3